MKKYLISLGTSLSFVAPIIVVISCSSTGKTNLQTGDVHIKPTDDKSVKNKYNIAKNKLIRDKNYGLKNYVSPASTNANENNKKEYSTRKATGEAFAPHFRPADIPGWKEEAETDGNYVRSRIPLAKRKLSLEQVTKTKGNGRYYAMDTLRKNTSNSLNRTSTLGSDNVQITQGLQYMTDMIVFGGSVGEGEVYIPRAQDIDAYHRMGVKVHACIFFAPGAYGGRQQDYKDLMGKDLGASADKLVQIAKYYGFDGWFVNDENVAPRNWPEFMKTLHKKAKKANIEISYYTNSNSGSVYDAGHDAYDVWFNDYYKEQGMADGVDESESPHGFKTGDSAWTIKHADGKSFWTYREWEHGTYFKNEEFVQKFLNGKVNPIYPPFKPTIIRDPRLSKGNGMAYHYKEYTPFVEHKSFATSFNKGEGRFYNVVGKPIENDCMKYGYANMALQDYLPTWKYIINIVDKEGKVDITKIGKTGISIENIETKNAWMGSDALVYKGDINNGEIITNKLFASEITLQDKDYFSMMYKGSTIPSMAVWTKDGKEFKRHLIDGIVSMKNFENNYKQIIFDVSSLKGELVSSFGIAFKNKKQSTTTLKFTLGKLAFNASGEEIQKSIKIDNIFNDGEWLTTNGKSIRLRWETPSTNIKEYLIYATDDKFQNKKLIDIANTPAIVLKNLIMKETNNIIIVPVNTLRKTLKEVKITIFGNMLDFNNDAKWSHKPPSKTEKYDIKTGHNFVGKIPDREGGVYFINDQVSVMHFTNAGILETEGNYARKIFSGKSDSYSDKSKYHKSDGVTYGSSFVSENGNIFISERAGANGLFVFSKGMGKANAMWDKYQTNNSIFTGKSEYITTMFEQKDGSLMLVSSLGNIAILGIDGKLTKKENINLIASNNTKEVEASSYSLGNVTLVSIWDLNGIFLKSFLIDEDSNVVDSDIDFGRVLDSKVVGNKLVIASVKSMTRSWNKTNQLSLSVFDLKTNKIDFTQQLKNKDKYISIKADYFNTVVLSNNGKKMFMRDQNATSRKRFEVDNRNKGNAYIMCLDISNISKNNGMVAEAKSLGTIRAEVGNSKYTGDYVNMFMLENDHIAYSTSAEGYVGMVKIEYNKNSKFKKAILSNLYNVIYQFKTQKRRINITSLKTFFGSKNNKYLPLNPYKK